MKISLGKAGKRNVAIDLATFVPTRGLVTADSGGGKSWLLRRVIEQAFGKIQIVLIDYEGEFTSLREKLDFVIAAPGGETPADVRSAALLAQRMLEFRFSLIADIYEMRPSDRHEWVRLFLESMIDAPKKLWHPVLVIIDEAHVFCPEKGKGDSTASEAMISLCTRGRKRGFSTLWASQRLATVNKDATSMLLNRMIGPTFEDVNRKRAAEILGVPEGKKDRDPFYKQIQLLEPGNFFCLGRAISRERVLCHVGPVATTHPETGAAAHRYQPAPPSAKIKALLPQLEDLPKTAEAKARSEAELKREIRDLKSQLRSQPAKVETKQVLVTDSKAIERAIAPFRNALEEVMKMLVRVQVLNTSGANISDEDIRKALESTVREVSRLAKSKIAAKSSEIEALKKQCRIVLARLEKLTAKGEKLKIDVAVPAKLRHVAPPAIVERVKPERIAESNRNGDLTPYQQSMIDALGDLELIGKTEPSWPLVGAAAGKRSGSSTFERYAAQLRSAGLIDYPASNRMRLTDDGRARANQREQPISSEELQKRALALLTPYQADILRALLDAWPDALPIDEIGERSSKAHGSSTFERYMASLASMEMIERPRPKTAKAADWLFL